MWVSESLYGRVVAGELSTVCLGCLPAVLATHTDLEAQLHPDQLDELANAGVLDEARALVDYLNRTNGGHGGNG